MANKHEWLSDLIMLCRFCDMNTLSLIRNTHSGALYQRICAALVTDRIQCYLWCLIHSSMEDTGRLMTQIEHFNMVVQECKRRAYPIRKSKWRVLRAHSSVRAGNGTRDCLRHLFYVLNPSIKLYPSFIPHPPPPPPPPPPLPLR